MLSTMRQSPCRGSLPASSQLALPTNSSAVLSLNYALPESKSLVTSREPPPPSSNDAVSFNVARGQHRPASPTGNHAVSFTEPNSCVESSSLSPKLTEYCPRSVLDQISQTSAHKDYVDINSRYNSFKNWSYSQSPQVLAEAGFFSTGDEDRVRCFMCNGGLWNWENTDIPWYEHSKWFGKCPYVLECQKHPVVASVIDTAKQINEVPSLPQHHQHHHHQSGRTQCDVTDSQEVPMEDQECDQVDGATFKPQVVTANEPPQCQKIDISIADKPKDESRLEKENEELKTTRLCKVCLDSTVGVIFLPCSHLVCCLECSLQVDSCPVCRRGIRATAKVII